MRTATRRAAVRPPPLVPQSTPRPAPPSRAEPAPISNVKFGLLVTALLVVSVLMVLLPSHDVTTLPPAVQGTWVTDAPRYRGRTLVIGARSISFQAGATFEDMSSHIIRHVDRKQVPDGTLFVVQYVDGTVYDPPGVIQFIYRDGNPAAIMLAHQTEIVWERNPVGQ